MMGKLDPETAARLGGRDPMGIGAAQRFFAGNWQHIASGSINRRIFGALLTVGGFSSLVRMGYAIQTVVAAALYGRSDAFEAFLIASTVPLAAMNIVGSSFNSAVIPVYVRVRDHQGRPAAQALVSGVVLVSAGILAAVVGLLALASPYFLPVLATGFKHEKLALTQGLFYVLAPAILLRGFATNWAAILNAGERFALASAAEVLVPLAAVASLLALGPVWGIYALAIGMVAGLILQSCLLAGALTAHGISLRPAWHGFQPPLRQVVSQYVPLAAGATIWTGTVLVDQAMAAALPRGSVAALNFGSYTVIAVTAIGTVALGTAVLPYFSSMVAAADWAGLRHSLKVYTRLIIAVTVPLTLLVCAFSQQLVGLAFQRGVFSHADTVAVSHVQALFVLQVPFFALTILYVRLIAALQSNYISVWGVTLGVVLNFVLDYALMQILGVAGIALATSLVYLVLCGFLFVMLSRRLRAVESQGAPVASSH